MSQSVSSSFENEQKTPSKAVQQQQEKEKDRDDLENTLECPVCFHRPSDQLRSHPRSLSFTLAASFAFSLSPFMTGFFQRIESVCILVALTVRTVQEREVFLKSENNSPGFG